MDNQKVEMLEQIIRRQEDEKKDLQLEIAMLEVKSTYRYEYEHVLQDTNFKDRRHLLAAEEYYTRVYIPLVDIYGYERVNNYLLKKLDEQESKEMVKDIV